MPGFGDLARHIAKRVKKLSVDPRAFPIPEQLESMAMEALAQVRDSLDGRYFGLLATSQIIGRAVPLWTDNGGNGRFEWRAPTR